MEAGMSEPKSKTWMQNLAMIHVIVVLWFSKMYVYCMYPSPSEYHYTTRRVQPIHNFRNHSTADL